MAGETRQKILEVTEKLIQMKGLARVTTKEIARATGLSEGALYRHFDHKEEVFFAIIMQHLPAFLETLKTHIPGTGNIDENLSAIALAAINYYGHLIPMGAPFLADPELLAHYRHQLPQGSENPETVFAAVPAYT